MYMYPIILQFQLTNDLSHNQDKLAQDNYPAESRGIKVTELFQ